MGVEGMCKCLATEGATTTKATFEGYLERVLAPSLSPGQLMALYDVGVRKKKGDRAKELVEERSCELS
jgi:hypothetical protein